jgi:CubicO group peptidase (beta-lactamase class C family)
MFRRFALIRQLRALAWVALLFASASALHAQYVPPPGDSWERRAPEQVGLDAARVQRAVDHALASESAAPRDLLENHHRTFGREPQGEAIGPFRERGGATGMIVHGGYIIAEWGDTDRVDVTFSVTKSFLSTVVGLAFDRGLIRDVADPVYRYVAPILAAVRPDSFVVLQPFASEYARRITWEHLLRQTSDWQGTLWGKPDWADRPRGDHDAWRNRARHEPGAVYMYNDVRVNLLALAALDVWRTALPQVLREHVMQRIGASDSWRWYGYDNSWVVLDGKLVQSVSGGAHWGGGMFISARDMARFGLLTLRRGRWGERQLVSERWIEQATTPGVNDAYGYMNFFLNTGRRALPAAPVEAFYHLGAGTNIIYVDPVHDLVIVARWIDNVQSFNALLELLLADP